MPSFRAKARAVDLLGKGQIADLPTAICELWKNGYDAYAQNLECSLYVPGYRNIASPLFTLSDDGTGMSRSDLEEKWIVLGTDSKVRRDRIPNDEERLGSEIRIPIGEKGIGRLSVAYLGSQMLLLTKKRDEACQCLFFDWRILDNYNLFLEEVDLPIGEISSKETGMQTVGSLINAYKNNFTKGDWSDHVDLRNTILKELDQIDFSNDIVEDIIAKFLGRGVHGTTFVIFNPIDQLLELESADDIEMRKDTSVRYIRASLNGINNLFKGEFLVNTRFYIIGESRRNIIETENFFEKIDFDLADHYFKGEFDKEGFFKGEVRIFDQKYSHQFRSIRKPGKTPYGPFKIELGFVEGDHKNTKLTREQFDYIIKKLDSYGGLYVYRDKFRVLPYGRPDYDWLEFEERRTRGAGYYFFSYRRMFGYVEITRDDNAKLVDKAGREGFITNAASREFKRDLIQFFTDLSITYMKKVREGDLEKGKKPTPRQTELDKKREYSIREDKKRDKKELAEFGKKLQQHREVIENRRTSLNLLIANLNEVILKDSPPSRQLCDLSTEFENIRNELNDIRINPPKRAELTDALVNEYDSVTRALNNTLDLIEDVSQKIIEIQENESDETFESEINEKRDLFVGKLRKTSFTYVDRLSACFKYLNQQIENDSQNYMRDYLDSTSHLLLNSTYNRDDYLQTLQVLDSIQANFSTEMSDKFESLVSHIEKLRLEVDEDIIVGYYKEKYQELTKKFEAVHELAQLGMAIEIIDHQFKVFYAEMAEAIAFFREYADENQEVQENFKQLRHAFEHLETNYQLLAPMYRTMRRSRVNISGKELKEYLQKFYSKKLESENISFSTDSTFDNYVFEYTYESIIKPVFVNIINNAIYWLIPSNDRRIHIAAECDRVLIMNSGEKIQPADVERIFELFFTRKPGGRGIGLYLARANLHTVGYDIYATNDLHLKGLNGACFVIEKQQSPES